MLRLACSEIWGDLGQATMPENGQIQSKRCGLKTSFQPIRFQVLELSASFC